MDGLLRSAIEARTSSTRPGHQASTPPVIEIMSLSPGDGKTHILYHLTIMAVSPARLGGKQACVVIIDMDGNFSIPRLAHLMENYIRRQDSNESEDVPGSIVQDSLQHVHVLRPQSLAATIAAVRALPMYLLNANKHHSFERSVSFIALDTLTAFYWQSKAEHDDAKLLDSITNDPTMAYQPATYAQLAAAIQHSSKALQTLVIAMTRSIGQARGNVPEHFPEIHSFKPPLPSPWLTLPTLRLVVHRSPVRNLPVGVTLGEARRESALRQKVVERGQFVCFVNEWVMDETQRARLRQKDHCFKFFVNADRVGFDDEEDEELETQV